MAGHTKFMTSAPETSVLALSPTDSYYLLLLTMKAIFPQPLNMTMSFL